DVANAEEGARLARGACLGERPENRPLLRAGILKLIQEQVLYAGIKAVGDFFWRAPAGYPNEGTGGIREEHQAAALAQLVVMAGEVTQKVVGRLGPRLQLAEQSGPGR